MQSQLVAGAAAILGMSEEAASYEKKADASTPSSRNPYTPWERFDAAGNPVEVRTRFDGTWVPGYRVCGERSGRYVIERCSDGFELPADFDRPLAGRVAVVTGAARGIGAAIAKVLHRDGARVICVDVPAAGEQLAKVSNETGGTALQLDITGDGAGQTILEHAHSRYGRLDIVVHNAGITRDKLLANMDAAKWNSVMSVNIGSGTPSTST